MQAGCLLCALRGGWESGLSYGAEGSDPDLLLRSSPHHRTNSTAATTSAAAAAAAAWAAATHELPENEWGPTRIGDGTPSGAIVYIVRGCADTCAACVAPACVGGLGIAACGPVRTGTTVGNRVLYST